MSVQHEYQSINKQAIKKAITAARGDNIECVVLNDVRRSEEVDEYFWEGLTEVQDDFLPAIRDAVVAYLKRKLEQACDRQLRLFE